MMKKAFAILGSPRKNGNAAGMLNLAVQKAEKAGYDVEYLDLYDQQIAWCRGCMGCKKTGICVIHDDADHIREALLRCDLLLISCPCYIANVPAPVKNMFDRLVGAIMDDNQSAIPKPRLSRSQEYILMTTCNTPAPLDRLGGQSTGCLKSMKEFFHTAGMTCRGKVIYAGTRGKNGLPSHVVRKIDALIG